MKPPGQRATGAQREYRYASRGGIGSGYQVPDNGENRHRQGSQGPEAPCVTALAQVVGLQLEPPLGSFPLQPTPVRLVLESPALGRVGAVPLVDVLLALPEGLVALRAEPLSLDLDRVAVHAADPAKVGPAVTVLVTVGIRGTIGLRLLPTSTPLSYDMATAAVAVGFETETRLGSHSDSPLSGFSPASA